MPHGPLPPISAASRQPRGSEPTAASLPITTTMLWGNELSKSAPTLPPSLNNFCCVTLFASAHHPHPFSHPLRLHQGPGQDGPSPLGPGHPHAPSPLSLPSPLPPTTQGGLQGSCQKHETLIKWFSSPRDEAPSRTGFHTYQHTLRVILMTSELK